MIRKITIDIDTDETGEYCGGCQMIYAVFDGGYLCWWNRTRLEGMLRPKRCQDCIKAEKEALK